MKIDDTAISHQNMLKCCVFTLLQKAEDNPHWEVRNGDEVQCRRGPRLHRMVLFNGTWRWVDPRAVELDEKNKVHEKGGWLDRLKRNG